MNAETLRSFVDKTWDESIVPELVEYIRIPNKSPHYDAAWQEHGYMEQAVEHIAGWCRVRQIEGLCLEVVRIEGRTPVIFMEVPGSLDGTVLLYGHLDKQPEMVGWEEGLGPWTPVLRGEKLYGRGGADDGYAAYASLTAIEALQREGVPHARCVILIEACEESGSYDLPPYLELLDERIGSPELVVCLDSGAGNYEQVWSTTSLRGIITGELTVEILQEGVHSGDASGIVPSSFRIARRLLSRLEDEETGELRMPQLHVEIPEARRQEAALSAESLGALVAGKYPFVEGAHGTGTDGAELVLARTWKPALSITGADGLPSCGRPWRSRCACRPPAKRRPSLRW
jgi:acetylornithine deacetylase/succinyl-diaminopimelate desuccinylase-like protein